MYINIFAFVVTRYMQEHEQRAKLQHFLSELAILGSLQVGFS